MLKCLHIFGAYFYRLARKHLTVVVIFIFIILLLTIFHLYSYKHHNGHYSTQQIGDFDYRPAQFLKGKQPDADTSYCQFNYGLPNTFNLRDIHLDTTPEGGKASAYMVVYNVIQGTAYDNYSSFDAVTYATQATPEFIYHIVEIARFWDGPISLAVFVPDFDLELTMQVINHLCHCYKGMDKVSLHLFYPTSYPPKLRIQKNNSSKQKLSKDYTTTEVILTTTENITIEEAFRQKLEKYRSLDNKTRAEYIQLSRRKKIQQMMSRMRIKNPIPLLHFEDCSGPKNLDIPTFRKKQNMVYPINVGRNIARNASKTNYFLTSDIELVPSDGLAPKFLTMVRKLMGDKKRDEGCIFSKTVFVVPLFEVERGEEIPHDKDTLVYMMKENRAKYFHQKVCPHCQRFPGLVAWLKRRPAPTVIEPLLIARREDPYHRWEPLYFGTQNEPWYSELLSWEGRQDKMTQMLEMCLQEYRMVVLDGGFLCHAASPKTRSSNKNYKANVINRRRYLNIIASLRHRYSDIPKCKVMWGC